MSNIYGYIRVSSKDQNEDRQLIAMQELEIAQKWEKFNFMWEGFVLPCCF